MSKPPSRLKRVIREVQLVLSVGAALLIVYALAASSLAMHLSLPEIESPAARALIGALLALGPLLVLAPGLCFLARLFIELNPWRLAIGSVAFVEAALMLLRWDTGQLESGVFNLGLAAQLLLTALAAVLAGLAAREAAKRMAEREAGPAVAAPAPDLGEQMRQVQQASQPETPPNP